jgi:hypothetical protein
VKTQTDVVDVLKERGLLDACTNEDELREAAASGSLSVYCGFDPTADSLHLGNLLGIVVLAWFQRCGHTPVALLGGATGRVGDPSGKSAERPVLDDATINANTEGIKAILENVLRNSAEMAAEDGVTDAKAAVVMNNLEWFGTMGFLEFLREVGKYARVGTMMGKDSVKTRLDSEQGMSFTEFSYQLLQGYDFCHLFKDARRFRAGGRVGPVGEHHRGHGFNSAHLGQGPDGRQRWSVRRYFPFITKRERPKVWQIGRWRGVARAESAVAVQVLPVPRAEHGRGRYSVHEDAHVYATRRD